MKKKDYVRTTARERKDADKQSWAWKFRALFSQTRKAQKKIVHDEKHSALGGAANFYSYRKKKKAKSRRRRKLVRAQRQGRRI